MSYNSYKVICKNLYSILDVDAMTEGSFLIGDDNTKYTILKNKEGTIFMQKDADSVQLDLKSFYDYDLWNSYDEMNALIDGKKRLTDEDFIEILTDNAGEYFLNDCFGRYLTGNESYFDPRKDKKKMDIFSKRGLRPVSIIQIDSAHGESLVNGIVLDLEENERFMDVYNNGIVLYMPVCRDLYTRQQLLRSEGKLGDVNYDDDEDFDEKAVNDEIDQLVKGTIDEIDGTAQYSLNGIWVIINNQLYYLSREDLVVLFKNIDYPYLGIVQEMLESKDGINKLLRMIETKVDFDTRPRLDVTKMEDVGTTTEDFLCKLVAGTHGFVEEYLMVSNYQKLRLKG